MLEGMGSDIFSGGKICNALEIILHSGWWRSYVLAGICFCKFGSQLGRGYRKFQGSIVRDDYMAENVANFTASFMLWIKHLSRF